MAIHELTIVKSKAGEIVFMCSKCKVPGFAARGVTAQGQISHLLICSRCARTLGEWASAEESEKELAELATRLATS
jgi:hypothetical protein